VDDSSGDEDVETTDDGDMDDMSGSDGGGRSSRRGARQPKGKGKMSAQKLREYQPSDWISMIAPTPAPFAPQINDDVMYVLNLCFAVGLGFVWCHHSHQWCSRPSPRFMQVLLPRPCRVLSRNRKDSTWAATMDKVRGAAPKRALSN
jgi:hypothetical protein